MEKIENLNDDVNVLRALAKEQSELVAAAHEPKPVCMSRHKSVAGLRQLSCDSAFEWPVGKDLEDVTSSDESVDQSVDEPTTPTKHAGLIGDKLTIQHKATAFLVAAASTGAGSKRTIYRNSCLLPWVF